jgi:hypothetical protein
MKWNQAGETIATAALGGAVCAIADSLNVGKYDLEHLLRAGLVGALIAVAALYRRPPNG